MRRQRGRRHACADSNPMHQRDRQTHAFVLAHSTRTWKVLRTSIVQARMQCMYVHAHIHIRRQYRTHLTRERRTFFCTHAHSTSDGLKTRNSRNLPLEYTRIHKLRASKHTAYIHTHPPTHPSTNTHMDTHAYTHTYAQLPACIQGGAHYIHDLLVGP